MGSECPPVWHQCGSRTVPVWKSGAAAAVAQTDLSPTAGVALAAICLRLCVPAGIPGWTAGIALCDVQDGADDPCQSENDGTPSRRFESVIAVRQCLGSRMP